MAGKLMNNPQTLSFKKISNHATSESSKQDEHATQRGWGQNRSPQRASQQPQEAFSSGSNDYSPMTQRWKAEGSREQPYNNVGSYKTTKEKEGGK